MKNLMTKENGIMLGVGVIAFIGVRYLLKKQNEQKSNVGGKNVGRACGQSIDQADLDADYGDENGSYGSGDLIAWSKCVCYGKGCAGGVKPSNNAFGQQAMRQRPTINIPKKGGFVARRRVPKMTIGRRRW